MKRIIAILLGISLLAAPSLRAQQYNEGPENDLNFSYGYFTISQFATVLGGVFGAAFTLGYASPSSIRSTGSLQLEYLHKTCPGLTVRKTAINTNPICYDQSER